MVMETGTFTASPVCAEVCFTVAYGLFCRKLTSFASLVFSRFASCPAPVPGGVAAWKVKPVTSGFVHVWVPVTTGASHAAMKCDEPANVVLTVHWTVDL